MVMSREVGDIGFYKYEDAYKKIRETNKEKRDMLTNINNYLMNTTIATITDNGDKSPRH
jgi:hypothetical protein